MESTQHKAPNNGNKQIIKLRKTITQMISSLYIMCRFLFRAFKRFIKEKDYNRFFIIIIKNIKMQQE